MAEAVRALAEAAGEAKPDTAARAAMANLVEPAEAEGGDVFYVVALPGGERLETSCWAVLESDFRQVWASVSEYGWVEVDWWCQDRGRLEAIPHVPRAIARGAGEQA